MTLKEFMEESARTDGAQFYIDTVSPQTLHGIIGIASEAGELLNPVKKSFFYGKKLDLENIREEIGDVMWYIAQVCRSEGWNLEEILQENIDKLRERYPEQFTEELALERRDKKHEITDEALGFFYPETKKKYDNNKK